MRVSHFGRVVLATLTHHLPLFSFPAFPDSLPLNPQTVITPPPQTSTLLAFVISDSSDRDEHTGIQRLKGGSNFYAWKQSVKNKLVSYNYWNITSGATPRPTFSEPELVTTTMEAQRTWDIWSYDAMCLICKTLSPEVSPPFRHR